MQSDLSHLSYCESHHSQEEDVVIVEDQESVAEDGEELAVQQLGEAGTDVFWSLLSCQLCTHIYQVEKGSVLKFA